MVKKRDKGLGHRPMLSLPLIVGVGLALLLGCQSQTLSRQGQPGAVATATLPEAQPVSGGSEGDSGHVLCRLPQRGPEHSRTDA